ncbi:peptidoglycan editing factor PgeF [Rodentibacter pneumotropicus]|uniref:peptidoglycan editing factor PgeF n=1 Tax=Rodentibacter pneumotropicus TaxID=758 RepID=UPI00036CC333|nr:peptidoglycan editing factor PgeF [Rodentibacter pneumotropicus]NBH75107.1 peptidoglycan editing factor PgeF [Rodentibacter pneumotropicus]THA00252.1 peptidoglycan editing factor PgeF [Rodentibacter pneumotropicus]THA05176.1 peptidoglycan editing factor PgeF [Rodentibacter pneumotropicus]THA13782.1 peptidoglycan editing factor PgeF [Rodentibacter pneumotropicus]THA13931.1 peptidoglycan editing factor PgeF [Rodentibacter pneumotropicus]
MQAIFPNWQAPSNIHAFTTTRQGGVSVSPFDSFNLGDHVDDEKSAVKTNRTLLVEKFHLPHTPLFLTQTHSTKVIQLPYSGNNFEADAVYTNQPNQVCTVMTADCLPVLFTTRRGNEVAAVHAGWRGLCDGVLEETVKCFQAQPQDIIAWLAPAIGPKAFQVGKEVVEQFMRIDPIAEMAFIAAPSQQGKYLGNLYQLATQRLNKLGITEISGGDHCTFNEGDLFFSYRRDGKTGRMASVIWFD